MKIAVAGTGYVGLVAGICFAEKGNNVICVDIDAKKIDALKSGTSLIYEPGLEEMMIKNYKSGRLDFTIDYNNAYNTAEIIFIGVGTPENPDGSANLNFVYSVARQIAESITKTTTIVVKSTVPVGTNDEIEKIITDNLKCNVKFNVVSNPEFLSQGSAIRDTLNAKRIIVGTNNEHSKNIMIELYKNFDTPLVIMDRRSAEMTKYASNVFLALKISYMNDIANLCELVGSNIEDVAKGMSYDDRIGNKFLNAGCGFGGSCFPKDTKALRYLARQNGYDLKTVDAAIEVNEKQKTVLINKAREKFKSFKNIKVAILGLTFKPGTDDLREAPSLDNISILLKEGAIIKAYDPFGIPNSKLIYPNQITYKDNIDDTLYEADVCFIFTEWDEFKIIDPSKFRKLMKNPIIFDGRNLYKIGDMTEVVYYSIGR